MEPNKGGNNTNKSKDYFNIGNWASRYSFNEDKKEINTCHTGNCACLKWTLRRHFELILNT